MPTYQVSEVFTELLADFEGKPRLKARRCEGDKWELGYGCTYGFDNVPFGPDDTIHPDEVMPLAMHCASREAQPLWDHLTRQGVTPTQSEIDALAFWAFNVGASAAIGSEDVTANFIAGRVEDAAAGFSGWTGATSAGPSKTERESGLYDDMIAWSKKRRRWVWVGQDGRACQYFRRMRGLLRRQLATGCVMLGYDWKDACRNDAVSLRTKRRWASGQRMWRDGIVSQTSFKEVERVARNYPREEYAQPAYERGAYSELFEEDEDLQIPMRGGPRRGRPNPSRHRDNRNIERGPRTGPRRGRPAVTVRNEPEYEEVAFEEEVYVPPPPPPPPPAPAPYAEDFDDWEEVDPVEEIATPPIVPEGKKPLINENLGYELDESKPAKSLDNSERVDGLVLQRVGEGVVRVGSRGVFGSSAVGVFQFIQDDPYLVTALSVLFASTILIAIGWFTGVVGKWKRKRGEDTATQPLG